jgi:hypothetical protein
MKRTGALVLCLVAATAAGSAAWAADVPGRAAVPVALDLGLAPRFALLASGGSGYGVSSLGISAGASAAMGPLAAGAGVELGTGLLGWQLLVPLRAGVRLGSAPFVVDLLAGAAPGVQLTRPILFAAGFGVTAAAAWYISPAFALTASVEGRYTLVPAYAAFTGVDGSALEVGASVGVRFGGN